MSMQEWPDDHLDELFRKSAEEFEVPFEPAHWDDMTNRLDQHDRQAFYDRLRFWGSASALTGLLLITLWWAWQVTNVAHNTIQKAVDSKVVSHAHMARAAIPASRPTPSAAERRVVTPDWAVRSRETAGQWRRPSAAYPARKSTADSELETMLNQPVEPRQHRAVGQQLSADQPLVQKPFIPSQPAAPQAHNLPVAEQPSSTETTTHNAHRSTGSPGYTSSMPTHTTPSGDLSDQHQPANTAVNRVGDPAGNGLVTPIEEPPIDRLRLLDVTTAQSLTAVKSTLTEAMTEPEWEAPTRPGRQPLRQPSRLSIMAVVSPDLSAIEIKDLTRPGTNVGIMAQYRLSNRLVLQTGAMISTKKYQTTSEYYVWPSNWTWDPWPSDISGTCTMIDVPLNIRYDWLIRPRGDGRLPARWFASTGLTSYFIRREIYTYDYADPSDPRIKYLGWDNQKAGVPGGKFGFSNLNISVGYERPISRHLSWQIEPFMKIPLQQVGFFKVKLLSTGAFVGLKYSF